MCVCKRVVQEGYDLLYAQSWDNRNNSAYIYTYIVILSELSLCMVEYMMKFKCSTEKKKQNKIE